MTAVRWQTLGLCRGSDAALWFPERGGPSLEAKQVCHACPVEAICLEYALTNGEKFGVWGGKSERERRRMRRTRREPAQCGTRSKYQAGCRCDPCTDAETTYKRERNGSRVGVRKRNRPAA